MVCADGSRFPMRECKAGERVLYIPHGAQKITIDDVVYLSMRDDNVEAVLDDE